jgi:hypothetical protein
MRALSDYLSITGAINMATLKYWIAADKKDECYSIIAKTKKEVVRLVGLTGQSALYETPVQREVQYRDAFDLFDWVTSEGGGRACGQQVAKQ